ALVVGLAGGYAAARVRRARARATPAPLSIVGPGDLTDPGADGGDDETRPTLVPVRGDRISGRNLAKDPTKG
ncbi:MAG: hypothetical protein ABMA64_26175, partial [Myxococcota bacterium]